MVVLCTMCRAQIASRVKIMHSLLLQKYIYDSNYDVMILLQPKQHRTCTFLGVSKPQCLRNAAPRLNSQASDWAPFDNNSSKNIQRIVESQIGVRSFEKPYAPPPDNPCQECKGTGRTVCGVCGGKGRTNCQELEVLPHGTWPCWCKACRSSGLWLCQSCFGTGILREPIGFRV